MKRKKLILVMLFLTLGPVLVLFNDNNDTVILGSATVSYGTPISESFEGTVPQNGWAFAHSDYYSRSTERVKDGSYALKTTPNSNGQTYDGVQYNYRINDGSIEGWFYCRSSNYLIPALWIRTNGFSSSENPSFNSGYWLRMYVNKATLYKRDNGANYNLGTYSTGYYSNTWYHLKLEVTGNTVKAWITTSGTFSTNPQISYTDSQPLAAGKVGFSTRTIMPGSYYATYVDGIKIYTPINNNLKAIVVAGETEERFTRDALGMYDTLKECYGATDANIILVTPLTSIDGKTVPRDYKTSDRFISMAFNALINIADSNDQIIVWWTGHGGYNYFDLAQDPFDPGTYDNKLYASELDDFLDDVSCDEMYIYLSPCQSGSFIDELDGHNNRAIYTSCTATGVGYATDGHSLFAWATYRGLHPSLSATDADNNNDGRTSLYELFAYCVDFVQNYPGVGSQYPQKWVGSSIVENSTYLRS
jgi:hypothetical protein